MNPQFVGMLTHAQFDLFAYISMLLGNRDAAKDVLQETNVMLMNHAGDYDDTRPFLPWAKAFAYNQVRTYLKKESRSRLVFDDELVMAVAEDTLQQKEESGYLLTYLEKCMRKLLPGQKKMIQARYFQGLSIESMAEMFKKSTISVYVQIHRIRGVLAECIQARMETSGKEVAE